MKIAAVILAAGLGKRMNSLLPKVLHPLHGVPMLQYVIDTLQQLKPEKIITVVGQNAEQIKNAVHGSDALLFVQQRNPKGTGDALLHAVPLLRRFQGTIIVVNGDAPLLTAGTIRHFLRRHSRKGNDISLLSFLASDPISYGRLLRDEHQRILSIVEERDATSAQRKIREVNSGIYAFEPHALELLRDLPLNEAKGEYYLTDVVGIARREGMAIDAFCTDSEEELMGVNTREDLEKAAKLMKRRLIEQWRSGGVTFVDDGSVYISASSRIGKGTVIYPNVHIEGRTKIGRGCSIFPNVRIVDSILQDSVTVMDSTLIEKSAIGKNAIVGPFARLRPGCAIGEKAKIGNFVEVKNSRIGRGSKAPHLSYLGDAEIGKGVNIGAGAITCNYDGQQKHVTCIQDGVFVGSDTQFIAPVTIARGAVIGAGSTITGDVPAHALALSRVRQTNIENWALRRQEKRRQSAVDSRRGKETIRKKRATKRQ